MSESSNDNNGNKLRKIGVATGATIVALGAGALVSSGANCNPDLGDVCVPGLTVPPDVDPVPGNPQPGETIPVSPTMPEKGTTTVPEEETTTTVSETTVPETTTPETETTVVVTTTATTLPPEVTVPPIVVTVPTVLQHTI